MLQLKNDVRFTLTPGGIDIVTVVRRRGQHLPTGGNQRYHQPAGDATRLSPEGIPYNSARLRRNVVYVSGMGRLFRSQYLRLKMPPAPFRSLFHVIKQAGFLHWYKPQMRLPWCRGYTIRSIPIQLEHLMEVLGSLAITMRFLRLGSVLSALSTTFECWALRQFPSPQAISASQCPTWLLKSRTKLQIPLCLRWRFVKREFGVKLPFFMAWN